MLWFRKPEKLTIEEQRELETLYDIEYKWSTPSEEVAKKLYQKGLVEEFSTDIQFESSFMPRERNGKKNSKYYDHILKLTPIAHKKLKSLTSQDKKYKNYIERKEKRREYLKNGHNTWSGKIIIGLVISLICFLSYHYVLPLLGQ